MATKITPVDGIDAHVQASFCISLFFPGLRRCSLHALYRFVVFVSVFGGLQVEEDYGLGHPKEFVDVTLNGSVASASLKDVSFRSMPSNGIMDSIKIVIFSTKINLLIPFGPAAILAKAFSGNHVSCLSHLVVVCS